MQTPTHHPSSIRKGPGHATGFTLMEVLISITIIIALAVVVVMITSRIKAKANQAKAVSSLRQFSVMTASFSAENNGDIHFLRDGNDPLAQGDFVKNSFWGYLQPYLAPEVATNNQIALRQQLAFRVQSIMGTSDVQTMVGTFLYGSKLYADRAGRQLPSFLTFNSNARKWGGYKKIQSFSDPAQVVYFTYGFYAFNENDAKTYVKMPNTSPQNTSRIFWFDNKTAPMTFLDGHVELLSLPIPRRRFE